jgi:hypothetical protein
MILQQTKLAVIQADRAFDAACRHVESFAVDTAERARACEVMCAALDAYNAAEAAHNAAVDQHNRQRAATIRRN